MKSSRIILLMNNRGEQQDKQQGNKAFHEYMFPTPHAPVYHAK
jgi:hypothetical protein